MDNFSNFSALENRVFKIKNPFMDFICPLCRTERSFISSPRLTTFNYFQITFLSIVTSILLWSVTGAKILPVFFLYWAGFEIFARLRFKSEIPCPHCGFDATWYKKDVKMARKKVKEFWESKNKSEITPEVVSLDELPQNEDPLEP